jgi:hypothetical protein
MKTSVAQPFRYSYEEFAEHIKAMPTVTRWEHTVRFGDVGVVQTSSAHSARVLDYFFDCYPEEKEAVHKAELFLSIYDYIGRHADMFLRKKLLEKSGTAQFTVESSLLRAVHYAFTGLSAQANPEPKKVLLLARAIRALESVD